MSKKSSNVPTLVALLLVVLFTGAAYSAYKVGTHALNYIGGISVLIIAALIVGYALKGGKR